MRRRRAVTRAAAALAVAVGVWLTPTLGDAHESQPKVATSPGIGIAEPGSYSLPRLKQAGDGGVLDEHGKRTSLHQLFADRLIVLSFIYTHCADPEGCPTASYTLGRLAKRVAQDGVLAPQTRLISLSFDPARDTPAVLAHYAASFRNAPTIEWQFVTPPDEDTLQPILERYGQVLQRDPDGGAYSHQLRVFLIDKERQIRAIYGAAFLDSDTLYADLKTLSLHQPSPHKPPTSNAIATEPGDDKTNYRSRSYHTHSRALTARDGADRNLVSSSSTRPLGLPAPPTTPAPVSAEQIALGRQLFFDRRLSHNDTLACASCHVPEQGFTHRELATPIGLEGRTVRRNAPSLYNVAYQRRLFHDARESHLEQQVWSPLLAFNEMANPAIGFVLDKLSGLDDYAARFRAAFGDEGLSMRTLGAALAAYERTLVSGNSPFDRWYFGHDKNALSEAAQHGFELFHGKAGCVQCHTLQDTTALFTDQELHNTGLGYRRSMRSTVPGNVTVGPGLSLDIAPDVVRAASELPPNDLGRYEITRDPADRWRYKTPSLRNVALTAPYMHDGSLATLRAVIEFYNGGGVPNEGLDPRLKPLQLSAGESDALVTFLQSLTGDNVDALTREAFATPIGDRRH